MPLCGKPEAYHEIGLPQPNLVHIDPQPDRDRRKWSRDTHKKLVGPSHGHLSWSTQVELLRMHPQSPTSTLQHFNISTLISTFNVEDSKSNVNLLGRGEGTRMLNYHACRYTPPSSLRNMSFRNETLGRGHFLISYQRVSTLGRVHFLIPYQSLGRECPLRSSQQPATHSSVLLRGISVCLVDILLRTIILKCWGQTSYRLLLRISLDKSQRLKRPWEGCFQRKRLNMSSYCYWKGYNVCCVWYKVTRATIWTKLRFILFLVQP